MALLLLLRRPVPLASVLEPVAHLGQRQTRLLGERPLLVGRGVAVLLVAVEQRLARLLLEAVHRLLAVPYGLRQRVLAPQSVLVDGSERPTADLLSLQVVRLVPHLLQRRVAGAVERMTVEDGVQLAEVAPVEGDGGPGLQDGVAAAEKLAGRQGPEEASEAVGVAALLERLAHARHLLRGEGEGSRRAVRLSRVGRRGELELLDDRRRRSGRVVVRLARGVRLARPATTATLGRTVVVHAHVWRRQAGNIAQLAHLDVSIASARHGTKVVCHPGGHSHSHSPPTRLV